MRSASLLGALLAFLVGRFNHRHTTIDVLWNAGFLVIYLACFRIARAGYGHLHVGITAPSYAERYDGLALVALWRLRLAFYLARRQRGAKDESTDSVREAALAVDDTGQDARLAVDRARDEGPALRGGVEGQNLGHANGLLAGTDGRPDEGPLAFAPVVLNRRQVELTVEGLTER